MISNVAILGISATAIFDIYLIFIQPRIFKTPFAGFALVGRWVGYFPKGKFAHQSLAGMAPVPHEQLLGWIVHYAVGMAFADILLMVWPGWLAAPTLGPAMMIGIASAAAPFCLMQPAFGSGFFASRTSNPGQVRLRTLVSHMVFGLSLAAAGLLMAAIL